MTTDVVEDLTVIAPEWDDLVSRVGAVPFMRPGWVEAWRDAWGRGTFQLIALRRGGRLAGVLPLERRRRSLRAPVNSETPMFAAVAEDETAVAELARRACAGSGAVRLSFVPAGPGSEAYVRGAEAAGMRVVARPVMRQPFIEIDPAWASSDDAVTRKLRSDLRRQRRKLADEGTVALEVHDGRSRLEELLAEGLPLEASGWKSARGTAILSRPSASRFYRHFAGWAADRGTLRLSFLRLDGRALAFQIGLEEGGAYYFVKGGYDAGYARFSPGKLLVDALIGRAIELRLHRFELLGSEEPWKLQWTRTRRELLALEAYSRSPAGLLRWTAQAYGRPAARRLGVGRLLRRG